MKSVIFSCVAVLLSSFMIPVFAQNTAPTAYPTPVDAYSWQPDPDNPESVNHSFCVHATDGGTGKVKYEIVKDQNSAKCTQEMPKKTYYVWEFEKNSLPRHWSCYRVDGGQFHQYVPEQEERSDCEKLMPKPVKYIWVKDASMNYGETNCFMVDAKTEGKEFQVMEGVLNKGCQAAKPSPLVHVWEKHAGYSRCYVVDEKTKGQLYHEMLWLHDADDSIGECSKIMPQTHYTKGPHSECLRVDNETNGQKFKEWLDPRFARKECKAMSCTSSPAFQPWIEETIDNIKSVQPGTK